MNLTDPISDMFSRVQNAINAQHDEVSIPFSKIKYSIAEILKEEGYVRHIEVFKKDLNKRFIRIHLKYAESGENAIRVLRRISKPSKRVYLKKYNIPKVLNGYGVGFITTNQGVKSSRRARVANLGGEYIGEVY